MSMEPMQAAYDQLEKKLMNDLDNVGLSDLRNLATFDSIVHTHTSHGARKSWPMEKMLIVAVCELACRLNRMTIRAMQAEQADHSVITVRLTDDQMSYFVSLMGDKNESK